MFQELSKKYHWTPNEISEMTLAQIFVYYLGATSPKQNVDVEPGKVGAFREKIVYQREWWMGWVSRICGGES